MHATITRRQNVYWEPAHERIAYAHSGSVLARLTDVMSDKAIRAVPECFAYLVHTRPAFAHRKGFRTALPDLGTLDHLFLLIW
ncbi:hypothetical protein [Nocardia rhizosphaerae]|uniref:Uncharacterized protein n=1 Tax=Nocardia rhizosphaerae TaxID=1691571 RepID=A0ABV8L0M6_9NOCA